MSKSYIMVLDILLGVSLFIGCTKKEKDFSASTEKASVSSNVYEESRKIGIKAFNEEKYAYALQCFRSVEKVAPPQNDLEEWINKCEQHTINPIIKRLIDNMIYIEGGIFEMGATSEQKKWSPDPEESPIHHVQLSSFYIGKYEVTQEEWTTIMECNPSNNIGMTLPVENVSWDDCQIFIKKLDSITGKSFRLPTEAEWEFAARGGQKSQRYVFSGSNNINEVCWYWGNAGVRNKYTHEVGKLSPNELGLFDMSGNVSEWCDDRYGKYSDKAQENPTGPAKGKSRVCRGGGYNDSNRDCRVSSRQIWNELNHSIQNHKYKDVGLRLAM